MLRISQKPLTVKKRVSKPEKHGRTLIEALKARWTTSRNALPDYTQSGKLRLFATKCPVRICNTLTDNMLRILPKNDEK